MQAGSSTVHGSVGAESLIASQWAYQRRVDGRDQVDALAHALDGVRMSVASPGAYDPARDGPIRFG